MTRPALLLALLALAACSRPESQELPLNTPPAIVDTVVAGDPLPKAEAAVAPDVQAVNMAAQSAVQDIVAPDPVLPPPPEPAEAACRRSAAVLIVRWEVTSPAYYTRRLQQPIWPRGQSGITWGVGYDGGHQTHRTIREDWTAHEAVDRLVTSAGVTGNAARVILPRYAGIVTPYDYAYAVFEERSLVQYHRQAQRAFAKGFEDLKPEACGALVSLVYNRGPAMAGDSRREMRALRDSCVPAQDYACMAREIRSMKRLWRGTVNEAGLTARRESEALLIEEK